MSFASLPPHVVARNLTPLKCFYCSERERRDILAAATFHDIRGCLHVCLEHATWRATTSHIFGHSVDCPYYREGT